VISVETREIVDRNCLGLSHKKGEKSDRDERVSRGHLRNLVQPPGPVKTESTPCHRRLMRLCNFYHFLPTPVKNRSAGYVHHAETGHGASFDAG
jgi:hypothetical protein